MKRLFALLIIVIMSFASMFFLGMHLVSSSKAPTVYVRISSVTCLQNRTGIAVIFNTTSDKPVEFTIYSVTAVSNNTTVNDVDVYALTEANRTKIELPYRVVIRPGEEVVLGFLSHTPSVEKFIIITDDNKQVELSTNCGG